MATTNRTELDQLIREISDSGWEVVDLPSRWRVTNPDGGEPYFIAKKPPQGNTLTGIKRELLARGWDETIAAKRREDDRQQRLAADRERNEAAMALATRRAQEKAREDEIAQLKRELEERDMQLLALRASKAVPIGNDVSKEVVDVDASFAQELLTYNNFFDKRGNLSAEAFTNRPLDWDLVIKYRDAILRHEWRQSHQGLAFDRDMRLVDGQHRLLAVIEADKIDPGATFRTEVTYDLEPGIFDVIDIGKKRTTADILALHNVPDRLNTAAVLRLLYLYDNLPLEKWGNTSLTPTQTLALYPTYNKGYDQDGPLAHAIRRTAGTAKIVRRTSAGAGLYIIERAMPGAPIEDFLTGLRTGADLPLGDARLALRRFSERLKEQRRRTTNNVEQMALFVKTWNAYILRKPLQTVSWKEGEPFPRPVEGGTLADWDRHVRQ